MNEQQIAELEARTAQAALDIVNNLNATVDEAEASLILCQLGRRIVSGLRECLEDSEGAGLTPTLNNTQAIFELAIQGGLEQLAAKKENS